MNVRPNLTTLSATADDWQLYDNPGREAAAIEINATIMNAINSGYGKTKTEAATIRVMHKYSELGAMDSEPVWFMIDILNRVFGPTRAKDKYSV